MKKKYEGDKPCIKQPDNMGLHCGDHKCGKCGWNPSVAQERHKETEEKFKEKKK